MGSFWCILTSLFLSLPGTAAGGNTDELLYKISSTIANPSNPFGLPLFHWQTSSGTDDNTIGPLVQRLLRGSYVGSSGEGFIGHSD